MIRTDLASAGLPYRDETGRVFDFHSLRVQFITTLARSGVHPSRAQRLARHSTIELTMDTYTHVELGEMANALAEVDVAGIGVAGLTPGSEELTPRLTPAADTSGPVVAPRGGDHADDEPVRDRSNPPVENDLDTSCRAVASDDADNGDNAATGSNGFLNRWSGDASDCASVGYDTRGGGLTPRLTPAADRACRPLASLNTLAESDAASLKRILQLWPDAPAHVKAAVLLLLEGDDGQR